MIVDIGSNTIRANVYDDNEPRKEIFSKKYMAGLASYKDGEKMSIKGIRKLIKVLKSIKKLELILNVDKSLYFATASLRNVNNTDEILNEVRNETGIDIEVVSDKDEAYYGFLSARLSYDFKDIYTVDIGGGSTEIVRGNVSGAQDIFNIKEGSLSLYGKNVKTILPENSEYKKIRSQILKVLDFKTKKSEKYKLIAMGGSNRALGNVIKEYGQKEENEHLCISEIEDFIQKIIKRDERLIKTILQVVPERIHTISVGAIFISEIMKKLSINEIYISKSGLREGYLEHKIREEKDGRVL